MKRLGLPLATVMVSLMPALLMIAQPGGGTQHSFSSPVKSSDAAVATSKDVDRVASDDPEMCAGGATKTRTCPKGQERCGGGCYDPKVSCCCGGGGKDKEIAGKHKYPNCTDACRAYSMGHRGTKYD
jgi:hypothetical protein